MKSKVTLLLTLLSIFIVTKLHSQQARAASFPESGTAVSAPVLKWSNGGCYSSWCETGWYSSPAVADLDGDEKPEVIGSPYTLFVLNGEDGTEQWSKDPPGGRTWPGTVVADIDNDGDLEIALAQSGGYLTVYDHDGNQLWSKQPENGELRGLSAYDLDNDGTLELVVTATGNGVNSYVYEHDGTLRSGWPQLSNSSGYAWGVYNDNAALGDLDGDGAGEIVVPSDVHYINVYEADGSQLPTHAKYGGKGWGAVGIWESADIELRGWGRCNGDRAESYRTNFAYGPSVIADVNRDGVAELVSVGNVYDCHAGYPPSRYIGVYIFNADRSRFTGWETVPIDTGAPLKEDYNVIETAMPNPVVVDLDGDGNSEILYASYDGRLHAFWLDKSEHHNWPYAVTDSGAGIRFASEPVVADLDNDGKAEVIFTSWPQKGSDYVGKLHILNYQGTVLHEIALPPIYGSPDWNGGMAAPTLANIDDDADLELIVNTTHSGFAAYDLPNTADARILWGTGRGNYQRSGSVGSLQASSVQASDVTPSAGDTISYTILLKNSGTALGSVTITDTLPSGITYAGQLTASSGAASESGNVIRWQGAVTPASPVTINFDALVNAAISDPQAIVNTVLLNDGEGKAFQREAVIIVNGLSVFLPVVVKN